MKHKKEPVQKITAFNFVHNDQITSKYQVVSKLGSGWEGEVYKVKEVNTGIERAAKLFFPHRNIKCKSSRFYAQKLHRLQSCRILIQYHTEEMIYLDGLPVTVLVSEYVEGRLLSEFVKTFPGKRLTPYIALHLLYSLAKGIEDIHLLNEYHGDLHTDNVIVNHFGLNFHLKLLDMYPWGRSTISNRNHDICSLIQIFHECLGGSKHYAKFPKEIKNICSGLKTSLILKKFRTISQLREHLEQVAWNTRGL